MEYIVDLKAMERPNDTTISFAIAERLEALVEEIREANKSLKLIANNGEGR